MRVFELSILTASEEAWLALLTTVRCLVADGEAPPVRDEVQCSSCGRSFAPHVLVKQTNKQTSDSPLTVDFVQSTFEKLKKKKKIVVSVVLHRLLRYAEVALKIYFRLLASADMESAVATNRLEWVGGGVAVM